jgi:hypothetical protein
MSISIKSGGSINIKDSGQISVKALLSSDKSLATW